MLTTKDFYTLYLILDESSITYLNIFDNKKLSASPGVCGKQRGVYNMQKERLKHILPIYFYNGFTEPKKVANNLQELLDEVTTEHNYRGDTTEEMKECVMTYLFDNDLEYLKGNLYDYKLFVAPTLKELQEENERYCLDKNTYLDNFQAKTQIA